MLYFIEEYTGIYKFVSLLLLIVLHRSYTFTQKIEYDFQWKFNIEFKKRLRHTLLFQIKKKLNENFHQNLSKLIGQLF